MARAQAFSSRWAAAVILLAAAALRIAHLREIAAHDPFFALHDVDSALYDAWARRILAGLAPDDGVLFLGPLYAYFMALVYAIGGATPAAVKAVQCALGVASVALVGLLARECFDRRTALVAAAIAAGYEMLIFYSGTLLVVNIQVPLVLLLVWLSVRALRDPTPVRWLACGLLCGLCALARQTDLLFAPALLAGLFALRPGGLAAPQIARIAALFAAGVAVLIAPFTIHNYRASGDFVLVNNAGGANLYMGNNAYTDGTWVPPRIGRRVDNPIAMREAFTRAAEAGAGRELRPSEVSAFWAREALAFVAAEPGRWLALELRKLALFFNAREVWNIRAIEIEREFSAVLRLPLLRFGAVAPFGLLGIALSARRWRALFPLHAMLAVYLVAALIFFVLARYRLPCVPLLFVFAGYALVWLWDAARARRVRALALAGIACLGLTAFAHLPTGEDSLHMAWYNLGNKYLELARWDDAIASYEKSIAIRPRFISSRNNLALAYERAGRHDDAIRAWRDVLAWSVGHGEPARAERARRHLEGLSAPPAEGD
ncbi:MAG: tetratricopeptide repeat protein [Deltaproteobacteria bacterium]|nr:MAG: tetratricopeptide repeat protein [Deltaproteobacteria bacterium]